MAAYKKKGIAANGFNQGTLFELLRRRVNAMCSSAGLVIKAGASPLVKGGSAFAALLGNTLVSKAANTDMAALSGTTNNATFNIYCFYIDSGGTLTSAMGTAGATLAAVVPPVTPASKVLIGFTIINPTGTGNFVGGTTALDDATVAPNAVHISCVGNVDLNYQRDLLRIG